MDFRTNYPDFAAIEAHIKRARLERSLAIAQAIANAVDASVRGIKRLARGIAAAKPALPATLKDPATR